MDTLGNGVQNTCSHVRLQVDGYVQRAKEALAGCFDESTVDTVRCVEVADPSRT